MQEYSTKSSSAFSRRQFLKSSTLVAASAAAAASFPSVLSAQNNQPIRAVVIGLGGRGSGAGQDFLEGAKAAGADAKIIAVADLFPEAARKGSDLYGVPADKCFSGFDAYQKALAVPSVNYAILATPPGFRASHFKAAIEAGKNVFMEKPVAVDGPGCQVIYAAAEMSKQKGLKVAAGTQRRHRPSYIETVKRIQDGAIGKVTTLRAYWVNGGPIWHRGDQGSTDLERQIRNWYHYIWLCGDHICEQHVHDLDVCNWIMNDHPKSCWGMGARQQLTGKSGEIWDNFAVEYEYANGVRLYSYCGQIKREWTSVSEHALGCSGTADMNDGRNVIKSAEGMALKLTGNKDENARILDSTGNLLVWKPTSNKDDNGYVNEHRDLIKAILGDTPLNEAKQVTDSTLTAIMGREAAYSGAGVEWDQVLNSKFVYGPELLYNDCAKMAWGDFRTLQPPMPSMHNILKDPPVFQVAKA